MLRSLHNRLLISHILPLIIIIPIMGVALISVLETQFLLPKLHEDLVGIAELLTEVTRDQPQLWEDPAYAQRILTHLYPRLATRVMLIAPDGRLVASSDPVDQQRINQILQLEGLAKAQQGELVEQTTYSQGFQGRVLDVLAPVYSSQTGLLGIIRLSYHYDSIPEYLLKLRYLIGVILFVAMIVGSTLGLGLAVNISEPIRNVTNAIYDLAQGDRREPLPESGPDEVITLVQGINYLNTRLHSLEQARHQLLANLIHELGTPLGAIRSGLQALIRGAKQDPELLDELLEGMDEKASRLQRLLEDLGHMHDQLLGTLELDRQSIDLNDWLPKLIRPWQEAAQKNRLQWEVSLAPRLPVILADPLRLAQVLENLINNAIKYSNTGGTVCISSDVDEDGYVWIKVSDTGPGISPEEQEKIFIPFYRGDQIKRMKEGLGLGLSIARDLVVAHGGQIEIESSPGLGSTFVVKIPVEID